MRWQRNVGIVESGFVFLSRYLLDSPLGFSEVPLKEFGKPFLGGQMLYTGSLGTYHTLPSSAPLPVLQP